MKIWLDDLRDPSLDINKQKGATDDMIWVKTAEEAINLIKTGNVTFISFDNDLGTKLEGYDVAKVAGELIQTGQIPPFGWNIHSANVVARQNLFCYLNRYVQQPLQ